MRLCLYTDGLSQLPFEEMVDAAADMGIESLEIGTGNWSITAHMDIDELLKSKAARDKYMNKITGRGMKLEALNCSGNQLAPNEEGKAHQEGVLKTFQLASEWGIKKIVMMSGLPGGAPGDTVPNWMTHYWPPYVFEALKYQWEDIAIPYWLKTVETAKAYGIEQICLENHANQLVYNVDSFKKLRNAVKDPILGMNFDPSHLMWMGGDGVEAIQALGKEMLYHVHIKDVRMETVRYAVNGGLELGKLEDPLNRNWNCVTIGYGKSKEWWKSFLYTLKMIGYDGPISIEVEDYVVPKYTGVYNSVQFLKTVIPEERVDYRGFGEK